MALPALALDDFTWTDLVTAARRRIPAASGGTWTLHAPVDPGVTLVELHAWLLEQRLFWLDQVPESMVRGLLQLLGISPLPVQCAATVLAFDQALAWQAVADGAVRADRRGRPIWFSTDASTTVLPVDHVGLIVGGADRTNDLAAGRAIRMFPADGSSAEAELVLWMPSGPPPGPLADPLALLLELRPSGRLADSWAPLAPTGVPPPATLTWWYRNSANQIVPWPAPIDDGTGGMRRSGVVRLPIPADWTFEPGSAIAGLSAYSIRVRTDNATFTAPPRLARMTANVMVARHRRVVDHASSEAWLPLPGNTYKLPPADTPPIPATVQLELIETSATHEWKPVADLAFVGQADRVFVVDRDVGVLRFGDGLNGRIARLASGVNAEVTYEVGGGPAGNLGVGLRWIDDATGLSLHNVVPAEGGADAELLAEARRRAADDLHAVTRAITAADYEALAITTPGVALARAHAAIGYSTLDPCTPAPGLVTVFVVPASPREPRSDLYEDAFVATPVPDPGALAAARLRLDRARLVTHEVCVRAPSYRRASLRIDIEADAANPDALRARVADGVARFLDPLLGGIEGRGWPFGEPLRPTALVREAQRVLGTDGTVTAVAIGIDGASPTETCRDVAIGDHALAGPVAIAVKLAPRHATRGGLR